MYSASFYFLAAESATREGCTVFAVADFTTNRKPSVARRRQKQPKIKDCVLVLRHTKATPTSNTMNETNKTKV